MTWVGRTKFKSMMVNLFRDTCTDALTEAEVEYKLTKVYWTDAPRFEDLYTHKSLDPPLTCTSDNAKVLLRLKAEVDDNT